MAINDLDWDIISTKLPAGAISVVDGKVMIDVGLVNDASIDQMSNQGVVKFFSLMFTAANKAQIEANVEVADVDRLTTFAPATLGANLNGYITLTRSFTCRAELATAVNIVGNNP